MAWFPDNPEADRLAGIVFDLRRELFLLSDHQIAFDGVLDDDEQEARRKKHNEEALMRWDLKTRRMILGQRGG